MTLPLLNNSDFNCVGILAKHCDNEKLRIAICEMQDFDMSNYFCQSWNSIYQTIKNVRDLTDTTQESLDFVNGSFYTDANGYSVNNFGMIRVMTYYAYSRYLLINSFNDTPSGIVGKTNDFSIPKSIKEIEFFAEKYRNMGLEALNSVMRYYCNNSVLYPNITGLKCSEFGCENDNKCSTINTKGFGFNSSIISK